MCSRERERWGERWDDFARRRGGRKQFGYEENRKRERERERERGKERKGEREGVLILFDENST
jgi:hypothetical protein